ncbi:MAG: hypothetical protein L0207_00810 [Chlamydiae bacterium]|nr:hypothetical protein [Chlamydiota bacterium]
MSTAFASIVEKYSDDPKSPSIVKNEYLVHCIEGTRKYINPYPTSKATIVYKENISMYSDDKIHHRGYKVYHALDLIEFISTKQIYIDYGSIMVANNIRLQAPEVIIGCSVENELEITTTILARNKLTILANFLKIKGGDIFKPKECQFAIEEDMNISHPGNKNLKWLVDLQSR